MKEITRIHLAKTAYDIELDAKKELEKYLQSLAKHTDEEVMSDIESRMVELLAERGVAAGGVVTSDDVQALRTKLGESHDFAEAADDHETVTLQDDESADSKRLYRDMDNALLGGVLSGIAAYFHIDPTIVRIIFVVLAVSSFGWALLIYVVLWYIVPPATSASQKLEMRGRPITAATIREFSEREFTNERLAAIRNVFSVISGFAMIAAACGTIALTIIVANNLSGVGTVEQLIGSGFVIVGGVFSTWFIAVLAKMLFQQDFRTRSLNQLAVLFTVIMLTGCGFVIWRILLGT